MGVTNSSAKSFEDRGIYAFAHLAIECRPVLCRMRVVECSLVLLGRCTGSHWASSRGASKFTFLSLVPSALHPPAQDGVHTAQWTYWNGGAISQRGLRHQL